MAGPTASDLLLIFGALAAIAGLVVLRLGWGRSQRSHALNGLGWFLIALGAVLGWNAAGAWGTAVTSLFTMLAAFAALSAAGLQSKAGKQAASNRRVGALADRGEPLRLGGRCLTFVLIALIAAVLGIGISLAAAGLVLLAGAGEADAYATALFLMPVVWAALAFALLMQANRQGQVRVLVAASIPVWPVVFVGALA